MDGKAVDDALCVYCERYADGGHVTYCGPIVAWCCERCAEFISAREHEANTRAFVEGELRPRRQGKVRSRVTGYWH